MQVTRPAVQRTIFSFHQKWWYMTQPPWGYNARSWGYNGCSLRTKHTANIGLKENYSKKCFFNAPQIPFEKKRLHYVYNIYIYGVKGKIALQIRVFLVAFLHTGSRRKRVL